MAGVCDYRERRTRLLFTIFRFCFSGRFLGRRRRRRTRRKLLAQREQRFSSSSKHCVWYLTFFLTLKKGCPFSVWISLSLPRGKKKEEKEKWQYTMRAFVFCTQTRWWWWWRDDVLCALRFCAPLFASSHHHHHLIACVCLGVVAYFITLKIYPN